MKLCAHLLILTLLLAAAPARAATKELRLCLTGAVVNSEPVEPWIGRLMAPIIQRFRKAFLPNGAVRTAEPTANHDYSRVWSRDSAVNSMTYIAGYLKGEISMPKAEFTKYLKNRVSFHQTRLKAFAEAGLTPGEPISTEAGQVARNASGGILEWGRDQNDGAALSALELMKIARILVAQGDTAYVRREIFDNNPIGPLKAYLEHISHRGITHGIEYLPGQRGDVSVEAWEEMYGRGHLYTALMQYRALTEANFLTRSLATRTTGPDAETQKADFARTRSWYSLQAQKIKAVINQHWVEDPDGRIYAATLRKRAAELEAEAGRVSDPTLAGGLREDAAEFNRKAGAIEADPNHPDYPQSERSYFAATVDPEAIKTWHFEKTHPVDALFVIALNHAKYDFPASTLIRHSDPRVLATVHVMEQQARRLYGPASLVDGVAPMQRYVEDVWQGNQQASFPHVPGKYAWTLVTESMATYHYMLRNELVSVGKVSVDSNNLSFLRGLAGQGYPALAELQTGAVVTRGTPAFEQILSALQKKGDAYLKIVRRTYSPEGESSEGFDPVTAEPRGPENLTWNWAEWLRAVWARGKTRP